MSVTVKHISLPANKRVFAVSDVHGSLDYLKGLLSKISFSPDNVLILLGDLIEKGPCSLETLQYIISLSKTHTVHALRGNCDLLLFDDDIPDEWLFRYRHSWGGNMILNELSARLNLPIRTVEDVSTVRQAAKREFPEEIAFLMDLPVILESEHYIFVHGGIPGEESLSDLSHLTAWGCTKNDDFVGQGHRFRNKWCVVGHWPTTLYRTAFPCAEPLVCAEQQILSIDGGCAIKRDGQLNAVLLPAAPTADRFSWVSYDTLPTAVALDKQTASEDSINIRHGDNALEILSRGEEFCSCRHRSSGRTLDILTRDIREAEQGVFCEDSTDYLLPVHPGDILSVIEKTSRGWLVKKNGVTGWYTGTLQEDVPCAVQ